MKATLEFDLPEDQYAYKAAIEAEQSMEVMLDIRDLIREKEKYNAMDSETCLARVRELVYRLTGPDY